MSQGNLLDPILMLGSDAQHKLSAVSEMMMETLNQEQMEDVLQLLNQTVIYMTGFEEKKQEKKRGFFAARRAELSAEDYYRTMEKRVDEISEQLRQREVILLKNRTMFEQLEQMNRAYRKELDQAIRKGRQELAEFGQKKEEEWAFQSEEVLTMDAATYRERIEKRIYDLEVSQQISAQMTGQLKMLTNNNRMIFHKIEDMLANTIVLWKNQVVVLLQKGKKPKDTTDRMAEQNRALLERFHEMIRLEEERKAKGEAIPAEQNKH